VRSENNENGIQTAGSTDRVLVQHTRTGSHTKYETRKNRTQRGKIEKGQKRSDEPILLTEKMSRTKIRQMSGWVWV
jgi:hypothetical protein